MQESLGRRTATAVLFVLYSMLRTQPLLNYNWVHFMEEVIHFNCIKNLGIYKGEEAFLLMSR